MQAIEPLLVNDTEVLEIANEVVNQSWQIGKALHPDISHSPACLPWFH